MARAQRLVSDIREIAAQATRLRRFLRRS